MSKLEVLELLENLVVGQYTIESLKDQITHERRVEEKRCETQRQSCPYCMGDKLLFCGKCAV